ncbi:MAG: glycosyltransferase [Deltaproteobacteria bacterium]|nr:glycosyltransferase [Deltaproteobacteria bacterium]
MSKIRIVHVLHSFGTGGLEKGIATLVRNASPEFEHVIVCMATSGKSERLLPSNTEVVELHKPPGNSLVFLLRLSRVLKSLHPDIVHTRNWGGMDGVIAARIAGIRSILHGEHGWEVLDPNGRNPKRVLARTILSRVVREYTCVSKQIKLWLEKTIGVKKSVTQIYNGVDIQLYAPKGSSERIRAALDIPSAAFAIGTVGRLDPIKDHPTLFRAFEIARRKVPNSFLLIVGDGPEGQRLEALAGKGVAFIGNRTDVPGLLRALDVFVLPSRNEGISNTILEAMATAVPVVATNVGGNPELVEDGTTGFLVEPGDFQSMASAFSRYFENPDLRTQHGRAGREKVIREFTIEKMVKSYEEVYERVSRAAQS